MGKTKNKKSNSAKAAANAAASSTVDPATTNEARVPSIAPEDGNMFGMVLPVLQPYEALLPDLHQTSLRKQQVLHEALYAAGCTAATALEAYLRDAKVSDQSDDEDGTSECAELHLLLNYVSVEMAADNLKRVCMSPDGKCVLRNEHGKILNEVAAAALSAFAVAASRRPSTKHVEYLMNPTASVDVPEDVGSRSSRTFSVDGPSVMMKPPTAAATLAASASAVAVTPCTRCSDAAHAIPSLKSRRKRSRLDHPSVDIEELSYSEETDSDIDDEDLDVEDESAVLTDHLDDSRCESPCEDIDNTDALLRFACSINQVEIIRSLVKIRGSPEYSSIKKFSILMEACCAGHTDIVRELLACGADVNAVSESHNTPLIYAATAGKLECLKLLVKQKNCDLEARNMSGHTALMEASSAGHLDIVKCLLDSGANIFATVENVDFKESSLSLASYRGHVDVVECLIDHMPDCHDRLEELHTGLLEAAMDGHVEVAKVLLDGGAPVNMPTENFESPLTLAACGGHYDLVSLLVERGADLEEANDEGYTPLMEAAREGHREVVELLLDKGANVNSKIEEGVETPLTLAASGGYLNVVELLVSRGGDLSIGERTPLYEATQEGHLDVADYIVKHLKKNEKLPDIIEDLNCALVCAAETNNMVLVNLLMENGANKDAVSKEGRTPLMEASKQGHIQIMEYLLKRGAEINKASPNNDATALSLACLFGKSEAVQFLLDHGANPEVTLKDSVSCIIEASRNGNTDCARIILDYVGVKNKDERRTSVKKDVPPAMPTSTPEEISQRPKIKPVSKLAQNQNAQTIPPAPQVPAPQPAKNCGCNTPSSICVHSVLTPQQQQQLGSLITPPELIQFFNQKLASGAFADVVANLSTQQANALTAAASAIANNTTYAAGNATAEVPDTLNTSATDNGPAAAKLRQQLEKSAMAAISAAQKMGNKSTESQGTKRSAAAMSETGITAQQTADVCNGADESMLAHFLQRSLIDPKLRDSAWTMKELHEFKELMRLKVKNLSTGGISPTMDDRQESMISNMLNSVHLDAPMQNCPGCTQAHSQLAAQITKQSAVNSADGSNLLSAIQTVKRGVEEIARTASEANTVKGSAASQTATKRKGTMPKPRLGSATATECAGSHQQLQSSKPVVGVGTLQQKLDHTSDLIRSKLDALTAETEYLTNAAANSKAVANDDTFVKWRELGVALDSSALTNAMIHNPVYFNRTMTTTATLTAEQQQQFLLYQHHQEIHNIQNTHPQCAAAAAAAHAASQMALHPAQINCVPPIGPRTGRRATQIAHGKGTCSGHPESKRSVATSTANGVNKVASYVDKPTEGNNDTALTVACVGGHSTLVSLLIQRGANVEHRDKKGFTPLILAATGGHVDCCRMLIDAGCQIDAQSERTKDTALSLACSGGRKEVVELLLQAGANKEHRNVSDYTPLSLAASGGYVDIIQLLLEAGAEINSRTGSKLGISPLMLAAMNGHDQATLMLLERGSDINAQIETNRNTALTLACFQGRTEVVRLLLSYGANVEHRAKTGLTPLMEAANGGYADVGRLLLKSNADPNAPPVPTSRDTALTIAADKGHSAFVEMLLDEGAIIDAKNKKGCTPLFLACSNGFLETVDILVEHGADVDALDNRKTSPLVAAFRKGHLNVVRYMVQHVTQYPNDQECHRYFNSLTGDPELSEKVKECLAVVIEAKAKQAEQANRAAESLLEQLAEEEALAESKKLSKKRLKEKKKAKKLAKKQLEDEVDDLSAEIDTISAEMDDVVEESPPVQPPAAEAVEEKPKESKKKKKEKAKVAAGNDIRKAAAIIEVKEETPESEEHVDENRVPVVDIPSDGGSANGSTVVKEVQSSKSRRQARRLRNNESGGGSKPIGLSVQHNAAAASSPQHSPNASVKTTSAPTTEESEWLSASSKKRASSRPATGKDSNGALSKKPDELAAITSTNPHIIESWSVNETSQRRRAFALMVGSSTIARVIGRAGQNINAIREATNAHIEVEKIATRREQSTRQITVKGSPESVRLAVQMLDLLIRDNDSPVNDIIRRVTRGTQNSPTTISLAPIVIAAPKTLSASAGANAAPKAASGITTNVWQQRAAIRMMKQSKDGVDCVELSSQSGGDPTPPPPGYPAMNCVNSHAYSAASVTATSAAPVLPSSSVSECTSASISPVPTSGSVCTHNPAKSIASPNPLSAAAPPHPQTVANDELKRKAPGFERAVGAPLKNSASPRDEYLVQANLGYGQTDVNLANLLNEIPFGGVGNQPTAVNSASSHTNTSNSAAARSPIGSHRSVATGAFNTSDVRRNRPLSEIWENAGGDSGDRGPPVDMNFGGLFGVDPKSAALWLPQSSDAATSRPKDDTWIDSASNLFSSFSNELNAISSNPKLMSSVGSTHRPHSSTDWTTNSSQNGQWNAQSNQWMQNTSPVKINQQPIGSQRPLNRSMVPPHPQQPNRSPPVGRGHNPAPNWNKMDVFNQLAAQLTSETAQKEKIKQQQANPLFSNYQDPYSANGNVATTTQPSVSASNHSAVMKPYLDSMQSKEFDISALTSTTGAPNATMINQMRASFYNQMPTSNGPVTGRPTSSSFGTSNQPRPPPPLGQSSHNFYGNAQPFMQPPPGFMNSGMPPPVLQQPQPPNDRSNNYTWRPVQ